MSYYDLKTKISLKSEEKLTDTMQGYENLALIASALTGGGKNSPPPKADPTQAPKTADEVEAALIKALG